MFDDIGYCTRFEHGVLKISHGEVIIDKGSKICFLYILECLNFVVHSSSTSEYFHEKNTLRDFLRSRHGRCMEVVLEYFNEFC